MHEHREFALISQRNKYLQIRNSSISHVRFIKKRNKHTPSVNQYFNNRTFGIVAQSKTKRK